MTASPTFELAVELISRASVTPVDAGCQKLLGERLKACGFHVEYLNFGEVKNLWAKRGAAKPLFVFAGHTDVVPPGSSDAWRSQPFEPTVKDGVLYGRGASDMKSGIAAMVTATERFLQKHPGHKGSIAFLFTSDEEGPGVDGTQRVLKHLKIKQGAIDYCLVGEPTSVTALGDTIKVGRRGSLSANVTIYGVQGHIAYPHLAVNPIHLFAKPLVELCAKRWDSGNSHFDPTSFQISNVHSGVGVNNVIPANLEFLCNFRYSPQSKAEQLETAVEEILNRHNLEYQIEWSRSSEPFLSKQGQFTEAVQAALKKTCGRPATLSTSGGTSDARFFAPLSAEVLELGSINASMHKLDEHVKIDELNQLSAIYEQILENTLT